MTARQSVLALKYLERQKRNYEVAKKLGVEVTVKKATDENELPETKNMIKGGD